MHVTVCGLRCRSVIFDVFFGCVALQCVLGWRASSRHILVRLSAGADGGAVAVRLHGSIV